MTAQDLEALALLPLGLKQRRERRLDLGLRLVGGGDLGAQATEPRHTVEQVQVKLCAEQAVVLVLPRDIDQAARDLGERAQRHGRVVEVHAVTSVARERLVDDDAPHA